MFPLKKAVKRSCPYSTEAPQDVEQYQEFAYDDLDTEALTAQAKEALERVYDRAKSDRNRRKNYHISLEKIIRTLIDFYIDRSSSGMVYPGYSSYQAGMDVQGEKVQGEKLNITLHASNPYSSEGILRFYTKRRTEGNSWKCPVCILFRC